MAGIVKESVCITDPFVCSPSNTYMFTGSGNWDMANNWINSIIPPTLLPAGSEIIINPSGSSHCILNIPQTIATGSKITVAEGKNFVVQGNVTIQ